MIKKRLQHRRDYKYKKGKENKGKEKENNERKIFDIQTYILFI
jgi:hypothetical protein